LSCQSRKEYYSLFKTKREKHRPQTETSRIDNIDEDKLSDTDEREPFVEPKAKATRRNFQSTWFEKFKWLRHKRQCVPQKTGMSPRKLLTGTGCPP